MEKGGRNLMLITRFHAFGDVFRKPSVGQSRRGGIACLSRNDRQDACPTNDMVLNSLLSSRIQEFVTRITKWTAKILDPNLLLHL
jgi:hypothetical protein